MLQKFWVVFLFILLMGCSILKQAPQKADIQITDDQISSLVDTAVKDILSDSWLTNYFTDYHERPILITSKVQHPDHILLNDSLVYNRFDMNLVKSGQVRIVKSTEAQRNEIPNVLAAGVSIDFVISSRIVETESENNSNLFFEVSLWNENTSPIYTTREKIEINSSEN